MKNQIKPLKSDECVFVHGKCVFVLYVDDGIFMSPEIIYIDKAIEDLIPAGIKVKDQGYSFDNVVVNIKKSDDGSIKISQPTLIQCIIKNINLGPRASKPVPSPSTKNLQHAVESKDFNVRFYYRSVVGKLNYLAGWLNLTFNLPSISVQDLALIPNMSMEKLFSKS